MGHPPEVIDRLKILGIPSFGTGVRHHCKDRRNAYELETSRPGSLSQRCVDLNTASLEELRRLSILAPKRFLQIVEERAAGHFAVLMSCDTALKALAKTGCRILRPRDWLVLKE